ncbi:hypothetical protein LCGC14_2650670, partial [marine sediment metagenome]
MKIKYYLIGEGGETPRLKKMTKLIDLEKEVEFLGFTDIETRDKYYKLSDVFIMPSVIEKESIEESSEELPTITEEDKEIANFFNQKNNYLLIPGDTIFDFHILAEIMQ